MFLRTAAGAAATTFSLRAQERANTWVFVGCYTARGQGIYTYEMDPVTGALSLVRVVGSPQTLPNPSFLALDPNGRYLFCGNEIGNYEGRQSGSVTAFSIDSATANLTEINRQPTEGRNPAHVSVDPTGRYVLAANYSGTTTATNHVAVIPIGAEGRLGTPTQIVTHSGQLGPNTARQEAPHAHQILTDPSGRWVTVNDLGLDRTFIYWFDRAGGQLVAGENQIVAPEGGGPRHLAFHPNGRWVYVLNELNSTLSAHAWDAERGAATPINNLSTLPSWYAGINTTAQVVISPDGRFVYASNRGHDSIAIFTINQTTGAITYVGEQWTFGETPRNINIDPTGNFMYAAHQNTDNIVTFRIDRTTGRLESTGRLITAGQPVCIVFLAPAAAGNSVRPGVTFHALQNPALLVSGIHTTVTLAWNAPEATEVEIHLDRPDGPNMGRHGAYGTTTTGPWVAHGQSFFLQDVSEGKPLTAENTLGTVRVMVRSS
jgi:6-phosphogluconolactonase